ncbi:MAG: trans-aconitate 2-methyltransferase [Actinomycetes bacterium]
MRWDPQEYLRFAGERGRPFRDLLARVGAADPAYVVDLGCGPGNLTATLAQRWPGAEVAGVDSSPEMIERARPEVGDSERLHFEVADLRAWSPARAVDVLVSNATFQWVPGHLDLFDRLVACVRPGGWFAFQVPGNFGEPSHTELAAVRSSDRWRARFDTLGLPAPWVAEPEVYLERLVGLGAGVDVWETTYLQVLQGEDAVLRWMQGTGLRPVLSVLDEGERAEFMDEYGARLRAAYPQRDFGTVLPYRRIFVVARIGEAR